MESGEEIRYGIEEAVVRLLALSVCSSTALTPLLAVECAAGSEAILPTVMPA
jgi:hypothetical protein